MLKTGDKVRVKKAAVIRYNLYQMEYVQPLKRKFIDELNTFKVDVVEKTVKRVHLLTEKSEDVGWFNRRDLTIVKDDER